MQSLVSRPVGGNYYLQWDDHAKGNRYTRRGTNAVSKGWSEALAEALDGSTVPPTDIGPLRRHRDEVLCALPKSVWLEKRSRDEAEKRARKQSAYEAWDAATDRVAELEDAIWDAEVEREEAQAARMKPADTSAGIRAQRERYEVAVAEEKRLREEHARTEAEVDKLWLAYTRA